MVANPFFLQGKAMWNFGAKRQGDSIEKSLKCGRELISALHERINWINEQTTNTSNAKSSMKYQIEAPILENVRKSIFSAGARINKGRKE